MLTPTLPKSSPVTVPPFFSYHAPTPLPQNRSRTLTPLPSHPWPDSLFPLSVDALAGQPPSKSEGFGDDRSGRDERVMPSTPNQSVAILCNARLRISLICISTITLYSRKQSTSPDSTSIKIHTPRARLTVPPAGAELDTPTTSTPPSFT